MMCHPPRGLLLLVLATMLLSGCGENDSTVATPKPASASSAKTGSASPWFRDVAAGSGLDFQWQSGAMGAFNLPEIIGGGVALIDYDGDGDLDVYFIQGGDVVGARTSPADNIVTNRLFQNDGGLRFRDVTAASGAGDPGYGMGVTTGDYDNDGDIDLYITNVGRNTLLRNDAGVFTDVTEQAGVGDPGWGSATAFVDIDADGWLDLYVGNYLTWSPETEITCHAAQGGEDYCAPGNYPVAASDRLYRNRGDGTFEDISTVSGIDSVSRTALGIATGDYDGDGRIDIFIANDGMPDLLWRQGESLSFVDVGLQAGCAIDSDGREKAGMGVGSTDLDDDGDLDLIVCNLTGESDSLFENQGDYFIDATARRGVKSLTMPDTRFGLGWLDFNNDGWLDLYEATGRVQRAGETATATDPYAQPDLLAAGTPAGRFEAVHPRGGTTEAIIRTSRGAAFGDLDGDGRLDVVVVNKDAPVNLYRNITSTHFPGYFIQLRVLDANGRDALGALVRVTVGDRQITRPVQTAFSYFAANSPYVHIGLGDNTSPGPIEVRWPDGRIETFPAPSIDARQELRQGQGRQGR